MRKPILVPLLLFSAATLTLATPNCGSAGGPTLPIIGKLPIPAPPSIPNLPIVGGGLPSAPSLPSPPSGLTAPSPSSLTGLDNLAPELVTQNIAYAEKPGGLSPAELAALLDVASGTLLPLVPNTPENPALTLTYLELGGEMEVAKLPPANQELYFDLLEATLPNSTESVAIDTALNEVTSATAPTQIGAFERSELTPALQQAVRSAQPVLNQTARQLDTLPALPSLPSGSLPSSASLPSSSSLTKMAALPKSSSLPSSSSITKMTKGSPLPKSSSAPSTSSVTKLTKTSSPPSTSSITKLTKGSPLPKSSSAPSTSSVTKETKTVTKKLPKS
jgi:hypothetical protein